jgi:hypothetical protein
VHVLDPIGSWGIVAFYTPSPAVAQVVGPVVLRDPGCTAVNCNEIGSSVTEALSAELGPAHQQGSQGAATGSPAPRAMTSRPSVCSNISHRRRRVETASAPRRLLLTRRRSGPAKEGTCSGP